MFTFLHLSNWYYIKVPENDAFCACLTVQWLCSFFSKHVMHDKKLNIVSISQTLNFIAQTQNRKKDVSADALTKTLGLKYKHNTSDLWIWCRKVVLITVLTNCKPFFLLFFFSFWKIYYYYYLLIICCCGWFHQTPEHFVLTKRSGCCVCSCVLSLQARSWDTVILHTDTLLLRLLVMFNLFYLKPFKI